MEIRKLDQGSVLSLLPDRDPWGHKGTFGKILLLCGSRGFTGAAYLAAMGALRTGAGLAFLGVPESIYEIEAVKLNEPVVFPLPDREGRLSKNALEEILQRLPGMDTVVIGPGLGRSADVEAVVCEVLKTFTGTVILDADGINVTAAHKDILRGRRGATVLTPHEGEFVRFTGRPIQNRQKAAEELAKELGAVVVLKGHKTVITDGNTTYQNPTGNPGMAVGGSGDVLAGLVAALTAQGIAPLEAAACGVWLHGAAGDICAREIGMYGMLPTDMLQVLPRLMK